MSAASSIGLPYRSIQQSLAVSGERLATMTRNDFLFHDPIYGDKLYCHLHSQRISDSRMFLTHIDLASNTNAFSYIKKKKKCNRKRKKEGKERKLSLLHFLYFLVPPFEAIHSHSEDDLAQMSSSGVSGK